MPLTNEIQCLQAAVKLLAGRAYGEQELRRRLAGKSFDPDTIDKVIANLLRRRYLDDTALCQSLFAKDQSTGKYGLNAIVARLKQRGFSSPVIQETIKDYDPSQGFQAASDLVDRRFARRSATDAAKIGRFLTARGFSSAIVIKILERFRHPDDE